MAPLKGLRVLEVGRLLPAPLIGTFLCDLGAEVIKLEPWPQGDKTRGTALFPLLARGKRLLAIPPKNWTTAWPHLLPHVDILILNHRPATLFDLQLSPDSLRDAYPHLITVNLLGHEDGRPGHDLNFLAESGVLDRLRPAPDAPPIVPGFLFGDLLGGTASALIRLLAALYQREKTGQGTLLTISITTEMLRWSYATAFLYLSGQEELPPPAQDIFSGGLPTYRVYRTRDGRYIAVAALENHFWEGFCQHIGRPDLIPLGYALGDPTAHAALEALFQSKTFAEWEHRLQDTAFCVSPVYTFSEAIQKPWSTKVWREKLLTFSDEGSYNAEVPPVGADNAYVRELFAMPSALFE